MSLFRKRCTAPGCFATARYTRCQDCGKPFCADHVSAVEFDGFRKGGAYMTSWTRFVCADCAARASRALAAAGARRARGPAPRGGERAGRIA